MGHDVILWNLFQYTATAFQENKQTNKPTNIQSDKQVRKQNPEIRESSPPAGARLCHLFHVANKDPETSRGRGHYICLCMAALSISCDQWGGVTDAVKPEAEVDEGLSAIRLNPPPSQHTRTYTHTHRLTHHTDTDTDHTTPHLDMDTKFRWFGCIILLMIIKYLMTL